VTVTKPEPYTAEGCTILLGNPALKLPHNAPTKTRFKMRQRLVGSAVEHAASLVMRDSAETPSEAGDFKKLFFDTEADDEETIYLAEFLDVLFEWQAELSGKKEFEASLLAEYINRGRPPIGVQRTRPHRERARAPGIPVPGQTGQPEDDGRMRPCCSAKTRWS
jgi:hypothetical protein